VEWHGYIARDGVKSVITLDWFVILSGKVTGAGAYRGKRVSLSGSWDLSTDSVSIERLDEGKEDVFIYRGGVNSGVD